MKSISGQQKVLPKNCEPGSRAGNVYELLTANGLNIREDNLAGERQQQPAYPDALLVMPCLVSKMSSTHLLPEITTIARSF